MQVSSSYAGAVSKPQDCEITLRHAMNFAAAIGDANPCYFDDDREEGVIAPPMLSFALTWAFGETPNSYWDAEKFPLDLLARQVHYTETVEFHRLMRPGDRLTVVGDLSAIMPHRAGAMLVIRSRATDSSGRPVFTEYVGTLLRGVRCTDKGAGAENVPVVPRFKGDGPAIWEQVIEVGPLAAHLYDGCADISNPIHTSRRFARGVGLPGPIVHGTCTLSWAIRDIVNRQGDADPRRLRKISCRFSGMVSPGSHITLRLLGMARESDKEEFFFEVLNAEGKRAISDGYVQLADTWETTAAEP